MKIASEGAFAGVGVCCGASLSRRMASVGMALVHSGKLGLCGVEGKPVNGFPFFGKTH